MFTMKYDFILVDDCTIDELKDCTSAYTNATAAFGRTGVKNCR